MYVTIDHFAAVDLKLTMQTSIVCANALKKNLIKYNERKMFASLPIYFGIAIKMCFVNKNEFELDFKLDGSLLRLTF